jgi:hypothetical protein
MSFCAVAFGRERDLYHTARCFAEAINGLDTFSNFIFCVRLIYGSNSNTSCCPVSTELEDWDTASYPLVFLCDMTCWTTVFFLHLCRHLMA